MPVVIFAGCCIACIRLINFYANPLMVVGVDGSGAVSVPVVVDAVHVTAPPSQRVASAVPSRRRPSLSCVPGASS